MPTTLDAVLDRVRSVCHAAPFAYRESGRLDRFEWDPALGFDVPIYQIGAVSQSTRGGTSFSEERTDLVTLTVGRMIDADYDVCRRRLHRDAASLTGAIIRDGAESGIYSVPDVGGNQRRVEADPTAAFLTLRLNVPVTYEAQY